MPEQHQSCERGDTTPWATPWETLDSEPHLPCVWEESGTIPESNKSNTTMNTGEAWHLVLRFCLSLLEQEPGVGSLQEGNRGGKQGPHLPQVPTGPPCTYFSRNLFQLFQPPFYLQTHPAAFWCHILGIERQAEPGAREMLSFKDSSL